MRDLRQERRLVKARHAHVHIEDIGAGALLGGLLLGIIEILGKAYVSMELGDALVFAVLIIVLLVKPTGLLGKPMREKV